MIDASCCIIGNSRHHLARAASNQTHNISDHVHMELPNCQTLDDGKLEVKFAVDWREDMVIIEVNSVMKQSNEYVAFGLSGSEIATQMIGSDVDVMSMDDEGGSTIVDYSLLSRAKCDQDARTGACPDTKASSTAHDDVNLLASSNENGIKNFRYERPLSARDVEYDLEIPTNRSVNVVWARSEKTDNGSISIHTSHISAYDNIRINFAQNGTDPCAPLIPDDPDDPDDDNDDNERDGTAPSAGDHGTVISISAALMGIALVMQGFII